MPTRRDALLLGYLPATAALAWLLPESTWPPLCAAAARISRAANRARAEKMRHVADILAGRSPDAAERIAVANAAHRHQARLQVFRAYRFDGWRPHLELTGREHIDAALAASRGAVLWIAPFVYAAIAGKMALHEAGISVSHLGGPRHGFSTTGFGARFLNPVWISIERRFVRERVLLTTAESPEALQVLLRRVRANQVVSITMGPHGRRQHIEPFLAASLTIANGAPALACRTGAVLLPVFTVRTEDGRFRTSIEPPADIPDGGTDVERRLVSHSVGLLQSYVSRFPDQFNGWPMVQ